MLTKKNKNILGITIRKGKKINRMKKNLPQKGASDSIRVCMRLRPLLPSIEDEEIWTVSEISNSIFCSRPIRGVVVIMGKKKGNENYEFFFGFKNKSLFLSSKNFLV